MDAPEHWYGDVLELREEPRCLSLNPRQYRKERACRSLESKSVVIFHDTDLEAVHCSNQELTFVTAGKQIVRTSTGSSDRVAPRCARAPAPPSYLIGSTTSNP